MSNVDHPSHYNTGDIEVIDAIEAWGFGEGFNLGNAIKYIARADHKNDPIEDLKKAAWYVNREIERRGGKTDDASAWCKIPSHEDENVWQCLKCRYTVNFRSKFCPCCGRQMKRSENE